MKFSSAVYAAGVFFAANAAAQSDPNVAAVPNMEAISQVAAQIQAQQAQQQAAQLQSLQAQIAQAQAQAQEIPTAFQSASVCPGEVKCGPSRPGFGRPVYNSTTTMTTTVDKVDNKTVNLTVTDYTIGVTTTVAAREGVCPSITDDNEPVTTVWVSYTNTTTAWFVSYTTVTNSTKVTIGVTSAVNCIGTSTIGLDPGVTSPAPTPPAGSGGQVTIGLPPSDGSSPPSDDSSTPPAESSPAPPGGDEEVEDN